MLRVPGALWSFPLTLALPFMFVFVFVITSMAHGAKCKGFFQRDWSHNDLSGESLNVAGDVIDYVSKFSVPVPFPIRQCQ